MPGVLNTTRPASFFVHCGRCEAVQRTRATIVMNAAPDRNIIDRFLLAAGGFEARLRSVRDGDWARPTP
jgi:hypothetical protein